ncbi:MAG: hypothetical protein R8M46_08455 [Ghiorsea sp.]
MRYERPRIIYACFSTPTNKHIIGKIWLFMASFVLVESAQYLSDFDACRILVQTFDEEIA